MPPAQHEATSWQLLERTTGACERLIACDQDLPRSIDRKGLSPRHEDTEKDKNEVWRSDGIHS